MRRTFRTAIEDSSAIPKTKEAWRNARPTPADGARRAGVPPTTTVLPKGAPDRGGRLIGRRQACDFRGGATCVAFRPQEAPKGYSRSLGGLKGHSETQPGQQLHKAWALR